MYGKKLMNYVPEPSRVSSDLYVACHYYPGWEIGGETAISMTNLLKYPDRIPLQGLYDGKNPEIFDWEIKWACEHGINSFIFCWYRKKDNLGQPVIRENLRLAESIHNGFLMAKYQHYMDFAIMWECQERWAAAKDSEDLCKNLLPFWVENYFSKPNYMKVDNKPIVYVYAAKEAVKQFGSSEKCAEAFNNCVEEIKKYGFDGIIFAFEQYQQNLTQIDELLAAGFDCTFQYGWYPEHFDLSAERLEEYFKTVKLDSEFVIQYQLERIKERIEKYPGKCMFTASVSRDATEDWLSIFNRTKLSNSECQWRLEPTEYRRLLRQIKEIIQMIPKVDIGSKILILDNWNEWGEGHYLSPCTAYGFRYLQAVREALTECDNLPDYRIPYTLDLGPYDAGYRID